MPNTINIRSEEVQEILTAVPNWMIRYGNTLILILLMMLLLMSWFIKYPDVIATEVMVTTAIPPEKIYAKANGRFDAFLVKNSDTITKHKPLAVIENTANYKDIMLLKSIVDTIKTNYNNFSFPIAHMPVLFLGDIENAYASFETNYTNYLLYKKLQPFSNQLSTNKMSILESRRRLKILVSQQNIYKEEMVFKQNDLKRTRNLFKKGIISQKNLEEKELDFLREKRSFENIKTSISNLREGIGNSNNSYKGNEIKKIQEENHNLKQVVQSYNQLKKAIKDWELNYVLSSSLNGKVSLLGIYDKNQNVKHGDLVFTIIPTKSGAFVGKIKAPVRNSGKIKIGQRVNIKLANYPSEEFGVLNGIVSNISLISDEQDNYLIDVSLPKKLITSYKKEIVFKQEMKGSAEIIIEELRLIERFFYQIRNIFDNN